MDNCRFDKFFMAILFGFLTVIALATFVFCWKVHLSTRELKRPPILRKSDDSEVEEKKE